MRTGVPILDGITYLKPLTHENPLLVRSRLAGDYVYGIDVPDTDWWRPHSFSFASQTVMSYNLNDIDGVEGVSGRDLTVSDAGIPQFVIQGSACARLPSLCMYKLEYSVSLNSSAVIWIGDVVVRLHMRHGDADHLDITMSKPDSHLEPAG